MYHICRLNSSLCIIPTDFFGLSLVKKIQIEVEFCFMVHISFYVWKVAAVSHEQDWDSWPPEERNLIWGQWQGLIDQRFLCNKVLLKYKRDRESLWHRHQKGTDRVPSCYILVRSYIPISKLLIRERKCLKTERVVPGPSPTTCILR